MAAAGPLDSSNVVRVDEGVVSLDGVSKVYSVGATEVIALEEVSLDFPKGQFTVILGPSGSGKTTLLNIVAGIDSCTSGTVRFNGTDMTYLDDKALTNHRRFRVGFVFQFFNLVPTLTARENIDMVAALVGKQERTDLALTTVGLADRGDHFPGQLSGGEQQRVAIARALVKDPPLLLCDEPTGELDFQTGKLVLYEIRDINRRKGKTFLLVTHNSAIGRIADRVIRLRSGAVVEDRMIDSPMAPEELEW